MFAALLLLLIHTNIHYVPTYECLYSTKNHHNIFFFFNFFHAGTTRWRLEIVRKKNGIEFFLSYQLSIHQQKVLFL